MKDPKYHIYLTNEERSEVLKSLIDLKNEMIVQVNTLMYWMKSSSSYTKPEKRI